RLTPGRVGNLLCLVALLLVFTGCKKDVATEASNSDANGYVCLKCNAKFYTDRSVFLGAQCPKCKEESLNRVMGYLCTKDQHVTIRPHENSRNVINCEKCQAPVNNSMWLPKEKELQAWGATKPPA